MTTLGWWWISSLPAVSLFALLGMVIYFITKRFGPATASLWSLGTLLLMSLIPILALSPTPKWLTLEWKSSKAPDQSPITTTSIDLSSQSGPSFPANRGTQFDSPKGPPPAQSSNLVPLDNSASVDATNTQPTHAWSLAMSRVPEFLGVLLVLGWGLALVRFAFGWWAVKRYLDRSEEITDPIALDWVKAIATKLDFRRPIALRQSKALASAATVGWRNPVVLFPANWESWTQEELQVVLAHEISHITRRDYLSWVIAQLSLTINIYHPVAHWLLGRLRQNQELAADLLGATICGSREKYLVTLSQLVLDQTNRQSLFLSRPMLSSRGTFLWRIEMLNSKKFHGPTSLTGTRISLLTVFLIALGVLASGLSLSLGETQTQEKTNSPANPKPSTTPKGKLQGRFTEEGTGKPIEGAMVRVDIGGDPEITSFLELISDKDGFYSTELPIGHFQFFGVYPPRGYYTQDPTTRKPLMLTKKESTITQNFTLSKGKPWNFEIVGYTPGNGYSPLIYAIQEQDDEQYRNLAWMNIFANKDGSGALTLPISGGHFSISFECLDKAERYELNQDKLKFHLEKGFDPGQIQGNPERVEADGLDSNPSFRLRDRNGKVLTFSGGEVINQNGQGVIRFASKRIPKENFFKLNGIVTDEKGNPLDKARIIALIGNKETSGSGSQFETRTDNQGHFIIENFSCPTLYIKKDFVLRIGIIKTGYEPTESKPLRFVDIQKTGNANFGTIQVNPGKTLFGKVTDSQGNPAQGAEVSPFGGSILKSYLTTRTDSFGKFQLPGLSYGKVRIWVNRGGQFGDETFEFNEKTGEVLITTQARPNNEGDFPPPQVKDND